MRSCDYTFGLLAADLCLNPPPLRHLPPNIRELVVTLFELGREVTSVLDLDELLAEDPAADRAADEIPCLCGLSARRDGRRARVAYSVGYPEDVARTLRLKVGRGSRRRGGRSKESRSRQRRSRRPAVRRSRAGLNAELVAPLRRKGRVIGALNLLSDQAGPVHRDRRDDPAPVRRARRRRDRERAALRARADYTETLETLAEIAREFASILNLDELLTRIANLDAARRSTTAPSASCSSTRRRRSSR